MISENEFNLSFSRVMWMFLNLLPSNTSPCGRKFALRCDFTWKPVKFVHNFFKCRYSKKRIRVTSWNQTFPIVVECCLACEHVFSWGVGQGESFKAWADGEGEGRLPSSPTTLPWGPCNKLNVRGRFFIWTDVLFNSSGLPFYFWLFILKANNSI